jgi:hypothetical protein
MLIHSDYREPESYKSYKNRFFNKYKDKARNLRNAIDSTSLKPKDKTLLKIELSKILNGDILARDELFCNLYKKECMGVICSAYHDYKTCPRAEKQNNERPKRN